MNILRPTPAAMVACILALCARPAGAQEGPGEPTPVGNFGVFHKVDPITDARQDLAIVLSGDRDHSSALAWGCFQREARLTLSLRNFTGSEVAVVYRFDQDAADSTVVSRMVDGGNLFLLDDSELYSFSTRAMTAARLVVRAYDADWQSYDYYFDLNGSGRALRGLPCVAGLRPPVAGEPVERKPAVKQR